MSLHLKLLLLQLCGVGLLATTGAVNFLHQSALDTNGDQIGLQRLDLLYLNEPAPQLNRLNLKTGSKTVVVFCQNCQLPLVTGAQVVGTSDERLAKVYALVGPHGRPGTGYAIIDSRGQLRYRSYDSHAAEHSGEIQRLVWGVQ